MVRITTKFKLSLMVATRLEIRVNSIVRQYGIVPVMREIKSTKMKAERTFLSADMKEI